MSQAVQFDKYGGVDVLHMVDVPCPVPGPDEVLVGVKAAGINPGESKIRAGLLHDRWPATFPSGEGSDLAGVVAEMGPSVEGFSVGDEVIGFTDRRASHAEFVVVLAADLTPKPANVSWEAAGSLFVAGTTAYAAVRAVGLGEGDTAVVAGATGGVGTLVIQLARLAGARVVGIARRRTISGWPIRGDSDRLRRRRHETGTRGGRTHRRLHRRLWRGLRRPGCRTRGGAGTHRHHRAIRCPSSAWA